MIAQKEFHITISQSAFLGPEMMFCISSGSVPGLIGNLIVCFIHIYFAEAPSASNVNVARRGDIFEGNYFDKTLSKSTYLLTRN